MNVFERFEGARLFQTRKQRVASWPSIDIRNCRKPRTALRYWPGFKDG
jgi:hypothetical protein